jgi:hypothetical protein
MGEKKNIGNQAGAAWIVELLTMTKTEALEVWTLAAADYCKTTLSHTGDWIPTLWVFEDGQFIQHELPEELRPLMNSVEGKTLLFDTIKEAVREHRPDFAIWCAEAWITEIPKDRIKHLDKAQLHWALRHGSEWLIAHDFGKRIEVLNAVGQTPERVCSITIPIIRAESGIEFGNTHVQHMSQEEMPSDVNLKFFQ